MTEVLKRRKPAEWFRALFGGSLSALFVGIALILFTFLTFREIVLPSLIFWLYLALDLPGIFLHTWIFGDPFAKLLPAAEAEAGSWRIIWLALVYWFVSGFVLSYLIKSNRKAVMVWLLTIMALSVVAIIWW